MRVLGILVLGVIISSCEPVSPPQGQLSIVKLKQSDGISAEYGDLVAVNTNSQGYSELWFVDERKTIRMVRVQASEKRTSEDMLVIQRN